MTETGYQDYTERTSTADRLEQWADDTPVAKPFMDVSNDLQGFDLDALKTDIKDFSSAAGSVLHDPLNALITAGLSFLMDVVGPLRTELEKVTGDSGALSDASETFNNIAKDVADLAQAVDEVTTSGFQNWSGDAKDAASQRVGTFVKGVQGTAVNVDDLSQLLELSSTLMEAAYNAVMSIIADCIESLIVTWLTALAAEIPTCGASTAAAGASTVAEVAVETANAAEKVEKAASLVEKIVSVIQKIMSKLAAIAKQVEKVADYADKLGEAAEKVSDFAGKVQDVARAVSLSGGPLSEDASKVSDIAGEVGEVTEGVSGLGGKPDDLKSKVGDTLKDAGNDVKDKAKDIVFEDLDAQENGDDDSLAQARQQGDGGLLGLTDQSQIDRDLLG